MFDNSIFELGGSFLGTLILTLHYGLLVVLSLFGLHRLSMVLRWFKYGSDTKRVTEQFDQLPKVTIQIPVFNERNVAGRIIDKVALMSYPTHLLQVQVVDDSTDDTYDLIRDKVAYWRDKGLNIEHVHRVNRQGFKAGALRDAMSSATGEYIAIFDADFMPSESFLLRTIHEFTDENVAMVQTRWEHLNLNSNKLTQTQAMMLDSHFSLEQQVRHRSNMLFNFNGTAGIWRVSAIIDAGHWSADTLTEDLDLSYRAQLRGWKMVYLNDVECPAELPADMRAFKSQQHRWAKGGIQVMKKLLGTVWRSDFSFSKKLESTFHLSNNFAYFIMLVDTLFLLAPSLIIREQAGLPFLLWLDVPFLLLSSGSHLIYLYYGQVALGKSKLLAFVRLPLLLLLGIALAFNNARAALEALANQESEFVRTPKSGDVAEQTKSLQPSKVKKYTTALPASEGVELAAAGVFSFATFWAISTENWPMLPFLCLLALGFGLSALNAVRTRLATQ
ncbi:MAG: glycosyltransferase [Acidiferrobacterales bacterium]|nr:glycosyltransferase [Acidiferrobacterales bacterium]